MLSSILFSVLISESYIMLAIQRLCLLKKIIRGIWRRKNSLFKRTKFYSKFIKWSFQILIHVHASWNIQILTEITVSILVKSSRLWKWQSKTGSFICKNTKSYLFWSFSSFFFFNDFIVFMWVCFINPYMFIALVQAVRGVNSSLSVDLHYLCFIFDHF